MLLEKGTVYQKEGMYTTYMQSKYVRQEFIKAIDKYFVWLNALTWPFLSAAVPSHKTFVFTNNL